MGNFEPFPATEQINLADQPEFDLGGMRVKPAERAVLVNGERRELQPRVMQVLVALARARPSVLSRDRLVEQCWDGRVVGDDALNRCILALRHLAQGFSPPPFAIDTVPRVGHRLIEAGEQAAPTEHGGRRMPRRVLTAISVLFLVIAAGFVVWQSRPADDGPASIAVLPFRDLGTGDSYFAEGIGEEILAQLAREPQFRVAGGSSSRHAAQYGDIQEAARRLDVEFVVSGTVRRQGDQVRVSAHLVRARDGIHLWSDSYDGALDDIFAIQRQIGDSIAGALKRKLLRPALSGPLVTNGNSYNLYLTARGLIRTRNRRAGPMAADLLRDAIQLDPGYAPAWASLGEATLLGGALQDQESFVASAANAQDYARHALRLAPNHPDAHRALGGLLGFGTPEASAHLRRAAELDPNSAENMLGLGIAHGAAGQFEKELAAYVRARELDPLWMRAVTTLASAVAEMGDRRQAEAIVRQGLPADDIQRHIALAKMASISGDVSEAVRRWHIAAESKSPRWSGTARRTRNEVAIAAGVRTGPLVAIPRPLDQRHLGRVWMTQAPAPSVWKARNRDGTAAAVYRDDNHVAAKLMLAVGRAPELAAAYDGPGGLAGIRRGQPLRVDQLSEVPIVALALRFAGRPAESDRILQQAAKLTEAVYRQGKVPFWFDADSAALMAVRGRTEEALARLDRAYSRGWRHGGSTDLGDIRDEPAFGSLHGHPRFERLRARLAAHYARERAETERVVGLRS